MNDNSNPTASRYVVMLLGFLLLALVGFIGYLIYPRFDLPVVSGFSLWLLAAAAGIGSFFSPCSFPLLITLLARSIDKDQDRSLSRAIQFGSSLALGASLFLLLTGAGIALGAGAIFRQVTFTSAAGRIIRISIGFLLVLLGIAQVGVFPLKFDKIAGLGHGIQKQQARLRREHPVLGFGLFGFGYILAGFG